jgi:hypothetical protein
MRSRCASRLIGTLEPARQSSIALFLQQIRLRHAALGILEDGDDLGLGECRRPQTAPDAEQSTFGGSPTGRLTCRLRVRSHR